MIHEKNFTIYRSSAGSGKTFTLVKEYLALALSDTAETPKAYRHILAITFTNKAAAEMKERIVKSLKELSIDDYSKLSGTAKTLLVELKKHPRLNAHQQLDDTIIRKRANNVLKEILHNYSDFAIGTIDSFVHRIVRSFAFDLKIPMSFELEMNDDELLDKAIDLLISKVGTDEQLTKALVEFTESKTDDEKNWHIENDLKYFAKNLLNEEGVVHIEKLRLLSLDDFFKIKKTLQTELKKFEAFISKCGDDALAVVSGAGLEPEKFAGGANGICKYFSYLSEVRFDKLQPTPTIQKNISEDKWYAGKASVADKSSIDSVKPRLQDLYTTAVAYVEEHLQEITLFKMINSTIYSVAVLNEIEKLLNEYKAQNNILHISEFNKLIARIVLSEPTPFIYERIGEKYNNYLIDEFQDTSVLQFQNLLPLIDNSLASGHFTMLVGDGKQAIYRWRGGEVEQFALLPEVFAHNDNPLVLEREQALQRNYNPQVLNQNYRSKREIIEFNNSIFRTLSGNLSPRFRGIYDALEQGFRDDNTGGYVQVEFIVGEKELFREQNYERIYAIINDLLEQHYELKDIAILIRKNTDGSDIANYLSKKGIEVISSDSLLLSNSAEVNFMYALLQYLNDNSNVIIQTELMQYIISCGRYEVNDTMDLNQLLLKEKLDLVPLLKKLNIGMDADVLSKLALYELCEELIRVFRLNEHPNAYLQFFLDEVLNYSLKQNNNLKDFINYWEDKRLKASLVVPNGLNAVTIMTIHRSKGLEFPVVILPFSNGKVEKGKKHLWVDLENDKLPQLATTLIPASESLMDTEFADLYEEEKSKSLLDSLNVLYVALTRPEERLYVLTGKPSKVPANLNTQTDMFAHYYQAIGEWEDSKTIYTFGEPTLHKKHAAAVSNTNFKLEKFNSTQWRNSIKMRAAAPGIWNLETIESKKNYGVLVHTALSKVKTRQDVEPALNSMFLEGLITEEERVELTRLIANIIALPELEGLYDEGLVVKNEAEIIAMDGDKYRLDRVVIDNNKTATIIDYKTGVEKKEHKIQIVKYADLLAEMGYSVDKRLLVYIDKEKIITV